jgi:GTP:adenosylcobinamide-phosphate guanylyltransferase
MGFEGALRKVKEIINGLTAARPHQDIVMAKTLFSALCNVLDEAKTADITVLVKHENLSIMEEVCSGKIVLSRCLQTLVVSIYSVIIEKAPGYAVRNIAVSSLAISGNKALPNFSRECAFSVCGTVMATRSFDCGSMISDIIVYVTKQVKISDAQLRFAALNLLYALVTGAGTRIGDCHPNILKLIGKCVTDKESEIRQISAKLITAIAKNSVGCTSVSAELLISTIGKSLEDDVAIVQDSFIRSLAAVYSEQIRAYADAQEQTKIDLARGVPAPADQQKPRRKLISKLTSVMTTQRKVVNDYQFRSVITHIVKLIIKAGNASVRSVQVAVLGHLIRDRLEEIDQKDFEWLVETIIGIFKDPTFATQTYEEQAFFGARLSHLFRYSITSNISEGLLIALATNLTLCISAIESHTEQELQFTLGELSHVILALGEAVIPVVDETNAAVTVHLRHSTFGVRSAAAYVLATLAIASPTISANFLRTALINAQTQARQLIACDGTDNTDLSKVKEQERLQRMFFFHGHTLALSIFLKNENKLSTQVPKELNIDALDFGLELFHQDVLNSSITVRHIRCSIVRAGSLIISSCLSNSQNVARLRLEKILKYCNALFKTTLAPVLSDEMMMYELMGVEAALVCIATLLWNNAEIFIQDMDTLPAVIEGLEMALNLILDFIRYIYFY